MKQVGKYNLYKGISTLLTIGTPIATLACCAGTFLQTPHQTVSATGIFAILIAALFLKDKLAENFKVPTPFVLSAVIFVLVILVESLIQPIKFVCLATMIASGVDELTFKKFYTRIEAFLPKGAETYKTVGFYFTKTDRMMKTLKEAQNEQTES